MKKIQRFSKDQLIRSERFREYRDILSAVLLDSKMYTVDEAETAVKKFLKGKVK